MVDKFLIHEFLGMPNSGKSSIIPVVAENLRRHNLTVKIIEEGYRRCPIKKGKNRFLNNCWGLADMIRPLAETYSSRESNVVLLDRGPYDELSLGKILIDRSLVTKPQGEALIRLAKKLCFCIDSLSRCICVLRKQL